MQPYDVGITDGVDEICQDCHKPISSRAKANVWKSGRIVCTRCLREREVQASRQQNAVRMAGVAGSPWLVQNGRQQLGPYPTAQLIDLLRAKRVDWLWNLRREGMEKWTPAARLFTTPELSNGRIELRDFGQGDGTYGPKGSQ